MKSRALGLAILASLLGFSSAAGAGNPPKLKFPVACTLGQDCYIQQYVDHDPTPGARDFMCRPLTYDTHAGTDIAVSTHARARAGVTVTAAAPGRVISLRDGMPDLWFGKATRAQTLEQACGNGVMIDHGGGWQTQYCHLMRGTVRVKPGQRVSAGMALGKIGMSGRTDFPHVHFTLSKDGTTVDPFAPRGARCGKQPRASYWEKTPAYRPGGILEIGFSDAMPDYAQVKAGTAGRRLHRRSPALVSYLLAFGGRAGDKLAMQISGPGGFHIETVHEVPRDQALFMRAFGRKSQPGGWAKGTYRAVMTLIRGGKALERKSAQITIQR